MLNKPTGFVLTFLRGLINIQSFRLYACYGPVLSLSDHPGLAMDARDAALSQSLQGINEFFIDLLD